MPTSTYQALATITLTSTDSEIVFSSIPAGYRDLIVVANFTETNPASGNIIVRFNSDTGSNYSEVRMIGRDSGISGSGTYNAHFWNYTTRPADASLAIMQIMDYSATDKHKTSLGRVQNGTQDPSAYAYRWANTAAITTITIAQSSNTFATGTFSLYGIAS